MKKTLKAVAAVLLVAGCASQSPKPRDTLAAAAPARCAMSTQSVNTCKVKANGKMICHLWVGGAPDQPFVYPYEVIVPPRPTTSTQVIFVWHLLDKSYRFADKTHGPSVPKPRVVETTPSFVDGDTTDDEDGETSTSQPERRYRYKFNSPGTANKYDYTIEFEVPKPLGGWQSVKCDPTITSSGT